MFDIIVINKISLISYYKSNKPKKGKKLWKNNGQLS